MNSNVCSDRKKIELEREKEGDNDVNVRQFHPLFHPIKLCPRVSMRKGR